MNTCRSARRSGFSRDTDRWSRLKPLLRGWSRLKPLLRALLVIVPLASGPAIAGEPTHHGIEITPFAGYVFGGTFQADEQASTANQDVDLDDAASFGLIVNWPADPNTEWEVYLSRQSTSLDTPGLFAPDETNSPDLDITYLQVGGTYVFEGELARPYIVATVGVSRFEPDDSDFDSENFFAFGIGGGVKLAPSSRFGVRLEGRVLGSVVSSDSAVFCRSGPAANGCLVSASGSMLWQWEVLAGLIFRL